MRMIVTECQVLLATRIMTETLLKLDMCCTCYMTIVIVTSLKSGILLLNICYQTKMQSDIMIMVMAYVFTCGAN